MCSINLGIFSIEYNPIVLAFIISVVVTGGLVWLIRYLDRSEVNEDKEVNILSINRPHNLEVILNPSQVISNTVTQSTPVNVDPVLEFVSNFKCKTCGATLPSNGSVVTCEYCGNKYRLQVDNVTNSWYNNTYKSNTCSFGSNKYSF